jgi:hypothetical protein
MYLLSSLCFWQRLPLLQKVPIMGERMPSDPESYLRHASKQRTSESPARIRVRWISSNESWLIEGLRGLRWIYSSKNPQNEPS